MKSAIHIFLFIALLITGMSCTQQEPQSDLETDITPDDIESHIAFLADDSLRGRETGTAGEARAANYIADHFERFGLQPMGNDNTFFQMFTANMSILNNPHQADTVSQNGEKRITRNVAGLVVGSDDPESYIVIGAHFDHLGMGEFGSLANGRKPAIHNGADDNASGTAGLLELAQHFSRHQPQKSLIFVAFSGEEIGLLGSQYFVENAPVPLDQVVAMINLDMIGRLDENKLLVFGTGSSDVWENLIEQANEDSLNIEMVPDGTGSSDHTSFYNRGIPVLHYFTDTHADYHRPSDDTEYINFDGEDAVLEHVRRVIEQINTLGPNQLTYKEAPVTRQKNVTLKGVTLGVTPDYGFEGTGMRITGTRDGGPAERAGLQRGDIIVKLAGKELKDIYEYMEVLNKLEDGQSTSITVLRDNQEITFDLEL